MNKTRITLMEFIWGLGRADIQLKYIYSILKSCKCYGKKLRLRGIRKEVEEQVAELNGASR